MKMLARAALWLLALAASPAMAEHATSSSDSPLGYAPEYACVTWSGASIGSGSLIPCPSAIGGGGGGSNAAAVSVGGAAGAFASQTGYVGSDGKVYNWVGDLLGHPAVSIFGTVGVSGTVAATQSGSWTIANTSFGISGTLPPFAAPPTVNLGTLNGAATATNQTTQITAEQAEQAAIGSGGDAPATTTDTTVTSLIAQAKQAIVKLNALLTAESAARPATQSGTWNTGGLETAGSAATGGLNRMAGKDGSGNAQDLSTSTAGVFDSPRAGTANRVITKTSMAANTPTTICPAATAPVITEIWFTVSGVGVSMNGGTLTTATPGTPANTTPDWATTAANGYYVFPIAPTNAITAYGAAGLVTCIQTLRQ